MEVDERLRWLEGKTNSSLHPKGEDLRGLLIDEDNRSGFLEFCNNSEVRHVFIHMSSDGRGPIKISKSPPPSLSSKSLFLLKSNGSSRITKETISQDVVYSECSELPLEHLELLAREVYLPMMSSAISGGGAGHVVSNERIVDLLHRLMGLVQVTEGQECGELVLVIPSLDVLSQWLMSSSTGVSSNSSVGQERRSMVIHVMESCVVSWMKQVKIAIYFDPNGSILKEDGKMAGPMAELKYWEHRLYQLLSVRDQLRSTEVLHILHRLDQAHSTYTDAFGNVHRDIAKAISDAELVLVYLNTLKPIFLQLSSTSSPDELIKLFPSLITTLALVWQHSGFYGTACHFHRLLRLISNELSLKARTIIGDTLLTDPGTACVNIRLALRMCSAFRGHYLDRKDMCEKVWIRNREERQQHKQQQQQQSSVHNGVSGLDYDNESNDRSSVHTVSTTTTGLSNKQLESRHWSSSSIPFSSQSPPLVCPWPARNAAPFHSLNMTMERCNDLLELVQTIEHFSELSTVASLASSDGLDPVLTDIYNDFNTTLAQFEASTKELLSIDSDGFEESFFTFRSSVKGLESRLSSTMLLYFEECPSLDSSLRLLESFQGLISRDSVRVVLQPKLEAIIDLLHSDILDFRSKLVSIMTHPPLLPNTPPTSTRLIWLKAIEHRISEPLKRVREAAPYLLEGEKGFTLRHLHSEVAKEIESNWSNTVSKWAKAAPVDIETRLQQSVLRIEKSSSECNVGVLVVNYDTVLEEVLREIRYLNGPVLSLSEAIPQPLKALNADLSTRSLHLYKSSLEVCVQLYNGVVGSLSDTHKSLFQHKLQLVDILIEEGVREISWTSPKLPDFLAKLKGMLTITLLPSVEEVLKQTKQVKDTVSSWSQLPELDIFQSSDVNKITDITDNHELLIKRLRIQFDSSMKNIMTCLDSAFKVVDVSRESSSWLDFLTYIDGLVLSGLKETLLQTFATLSSRAQRYEQGGTIPPLVGVSLTLRGKEVVFEPPLSSLYELESIPEVIRKVFDEILLLAGNLQRLLPTEGNYYTAIVDDSIVQSVTQKITAHVETSARQCQSLCKRFTQYGFLWEQDVIATFNGFIMGVAEPHPRKFTRPETVNRTRSASRSARSRNHSAKLHSSSVMQSNSAVLEVVSGYSDWEFLKPNNNEVKSDGSDNSTSATPVVPSSQQKKHRNTSLEDFDGELSVFQGILERLAKSPDNVEVGWIRVDQLPVKDTLVTLANKWIYVYTNYLHKKVSDVLYELEDFFTELEPEVESISGDDIDPSHIMKLVTILNKVNLKQVTMDGKFGAVHRAVVLLDKFKHPLSVESRNQFEAVPHRWSSLKKRLSLSKQRLTPHVQSHSVAITKDLRDFDNHLQSLHSSFLSSQCLHSTCDEDTALSMIRDYTADLSVYQAQCQDLMELQELLQSAVVNFSLLKLFEEELKTAGSIWQEKNKFMLLQADWKSMVWTSVNTEEVKTLCDSQLTTLYSMRDFVKKWDIKTKLEAEINEILYTIPLVEGLCSPYMRPRHWKQVLKYSPNLVLLNTLIKNGAVDANALHDMSFEKIMELKLIAHSDDVLAIVDKASKDIAVEELLKNLEEVWLSMTLQFKSHSRLYGGDQAMGDISTGFSSSTDNGDSRPVSSVKRKSVSSGRVSVISATPTTKDHPILLLENFTDILNSLDHYQSSLQSLHGSITASSFKDELSQWHKQLQTVEAVILVWMKVQTLWVQLEEVLSSKEVEQYLPTQHFMFTTSMDKDWRVLMKDTAKTPNVLRVCLQEDLLSSLEKFLDTLTLCQTALLNYMENRRSRCPWFYFLQLEDILNLVCYRSRVQILSECIPKLIPNTTSLIMIDSLPGSVLTPPTPHHHTSHSSPFITGIVCSDGHTLQLTELVKCEGPVESIINHLMYSIAKTLTKQMESCVTDHLSKSNAAIYDSADGHALSSLPSLWTSSNTHQVIVLITQMAVHQYIVKTVQSNQSPSHVECLEQILVTLKQLLSKMQTLIDARDSSAFNDPPLSALSNLPNTREGRDSLPDSFAAVKASESRSRMSAGHMSETAIDSPSIIDKGDSLTNSAVTAGKLSRHRALYSHLVSILLTYTAKIRNMMTLTDDIQSSTDWQYMIRYTSTNARGYWLNGPGAGGVPYGLSYTECLPVVSLPHLEDIARHTLLTIRNNCFDLFCSDESSVSCCSVMSMVKELSAMFGYQVFPIICSPHMDHTDLVNIFKGIASTGCWLYLHNVHLLPVHVLQSVVQYLDVIKKARESSQRTVEIGGETLKEPKLDQLFCIASTSKELLPRLPSSIYSVFKVYMCDKGVPLNNEIVIESFLTSGGFKNVNFLKNSLSSISTNAGIHCSVMHSIIERSLDHIHCSSHDEDPGPMVVFPVKFPSSVCHQVMSLMMSRGVSVGSQTPVHSRKQSAAKAKLQNITEEDEQDEGSGDGDTNMGSVVLSHNVEILAIIVSIWELLLPQYVTDIDGYNHLMHSLVTAFSGAADVGGIIDKANELCSETAVRYSWSREVIESLQESRATSVMYSEHSDGKLTSSIEDTILHCCLLHGVHPCGSFLHSVHSLVLQLTMNRVVTVGGPGCTGERGVVNTGIESMKMMGYNITTNTIPVHAIGEQQLLGNSREDLLSYLDSNGLSSTDPSDSSSTGLCSLHIVILEGSPSPLLMDALKWLSVSRSLLSTPNMKSAVLDSSIKFIVMSPVCTPGHPPSLHGTITTSSSCLSWRSIVEQSLLSLDKSVHYSLLELSDVYLTSVLHLFMSEPGDEEGGVASSIALESQVILPNQLQLVKSMCRILKCLFMSPVTTPSEGAIERGFMYSLIWSFGSALHIKGAFEQYMRNTFTDSLTLMEAGTLWEYQLDEEDDYTFKHCDTTQQCVSSGGFIYTSKTAAINALLRLLYRHNESVIIDGPVGSGKTSFLINSVPDADSADDDSGLSIVHLLMNQEYTTGDMWTQLKERLTWHSGTTYIPMGGTETLIVMVDDLHLTQNGSKGSISSLIQYHVSSGRVCVPNKEHSVSNTLYVCTTDTSTHHEQQQELLDDLLYIHWDQYSSSELVSIYVKILSSHFLSEGSSSLDSKCLSLLVSSSVQVHTKMNEAFIATKERRHYRYSLSTLDSVMSTLTVQLKPSSCSPLYLLTVWIRELYCTYSAGMTSTVDREVFTECMTTAIKKYFCDHPLLNQLLLLVPYKLPSETRHSVQATLLQTHQNLDLTTPTPLPYLHDSIIEIASRISHHLSLPHWLSTLVVVGVAQIDPLVQLVSSANGYAVMRPSQICCSKLLNEDERGIPSSSDGVYNLRGFKNALKTIYTTAALKNEQVLVFLDDRELVHPNFLPAVYQFVKECSISVEYTREEKVKLTNALRPDVTAEGGEFSQTKAWAFFINRVKHNVRFLLSFTDFSMADEKGFIQYRDLINSTRILYQLPWDRKYLLYIAKDQLKNSLNLPHHLLDNCTHLLSTIHVKMCDTLSNRALPFPTNEQFQYLVLRFCHELKLWMEMLSDNASQLDTAIMCVQTTRETVDQLMNKLNRETIVMEEKAKSYSQLTVQMGQDQAIAEEQSKLVARQTERIQHLQQVLPEYEHIYEQYQEELCRIEDSTKDIVLNLDQHSLLDLRSQPKPPVIVQELLEAVIIIVKSPTADLSWTKGAKRLMANTDRFRDMLMEFSQNQEVSDVLLSALHSYTIKSGFNEDDMIKDTKGCIAAGQLCSWVLGVESYHKMLRDNIRPIDSRRAHVRASLNEYTDKLNQLQQKVKVLNDRLEGLGTAIEQASIDKSQQEKVVFQMKKELREAEKLVQALSSVNKGWNNQSSLLSTALSHHIGPLSLGVAFITYLTKYPPHVVQDVVCNILRPCITGIGFSIDNDHLFNGLLDQLCPAPTSSKPVPPFSTQPLDSVPFQSQADSFSDQPDHLHSIPQENPVCPDSITCSQYIELCREIISTINPTRSRYAQRGRMATSPNVAEADNVWLDIVHSSWNGWPLVMDPENCLQFDKEWNMLSANEMSLDVILSLEQSMIEGHKVVLTDVCLPFHPALLPVIEVGRHWNSFGTRSPFIEFCGRRLHINRSFSLILTTPTSCVVPSNGVDGLVLNMAPSVPTVQSCILDCVINTMRTLFDVAEYSSIMGRVTNDLCTMETMNSTLLGQLVKMKDNGESMTVTVDRVEQIMANANQAVSSLQELYSSLQPYQSTLPSLVSVCTFGSMVYLLLHQLPEDKNVWFYTSLTEFQQCLIQALNDEDVIKWWNDDQLNENNRRLVFESAFRKTLTKVVSTKLLTVLSYPDMMTVIGGLLLIDKVGGDLSIPIANQIDQILYVISNEEYVWSSSRAESESTLPVKPDHIPVELFTKLISLPIKPATLDAVYNSMIEKPTEWAELVNIESMLPPKTLPWKDDSTSLHTLEDLVVLRTVSVLMVRSGIINSATEYYQTLVQSSHGHQTLQQLLILDEEQSVTNLRVILYNNEDILSQSNLIILEDTLKQSMGDSKSFITFDGCSQSIDVLFSKMSSCVEDVIVIKNAHQLLSSQYSSNSSVSRRLIDFIGGDFHRKEKLLILLIDSHAAVTGSIARDILAVGDRTLNLSSVIPTKLSRTDLIQQLNSTNTHARFLHSMLLSLSTLSHRLTLSQSQPHPLPGTLVFILVALHCHMLTVWERNNGNMPQLATLVNLLSGSFKIKDNVNTTIALLIDFIKHQYTSEDSEDMIQSFLQSDLLNDDSAILTAIDGLPLPLPSTTVPVEQYVDHVIGIIDTLQEQQVTTPLNAGYQLDTNFFHNYLRLLN